MENRGPRARGGPGGPHPAAATSRGITGCSVCMKTHRATAEEIKTAYRREAMEWHPDKHQGTDERKGGEDVQAAAEGVPGAGNQQERDVYDAQ